MRRRSRVLRLRRWLIVLGLAFLVLLVAVIGIARYRMRHALLRLPHRLGIDIQSQTDGYTFSKSAGGRTLFTVHAAKAFQHTNGKTTLHDVAITLFGPAGSGKTDSIRGAEFEYDQKEQIVRAMGDTLVDIGAPGPAADAKGTPAKRITIEGEGFVFLQKLGVASTTQPIRFQYGASHGTAVGADYDMDTGVLMLQHDVHLESLENGHPERISAASARLDRAGHTATLTNGVLQDAADTLRAPSIVATLRQATNDDAASLQHVHASGGVTLRSGNGEEAQAPVLDAALSVQNQLEVVTMTGGAVLTDEATHATAEQVELLFRKGAANHLLLAGQVHIVQTQGAAGAQRTLTAARVESTLLTVGGARLAPGTVHASGGATFVMVQMGARGGSPQRSELAGPTIDAETAPRSGGGPLEVRSVRAMQGARLQQDDGAGTVTTSASDQLTALLTGGDRQGAAAIDNVLQQGKVAIRQIVAATPATATRPARAAGQSNAHAERADLQGATHVLTLTGSPQVSGNGLDLAAERIQLHQDTGDAEATGAVRGRFVQVSAAPAAGQRTATSSASGSASSAAAPNATSFTGSLLQFSHATSVVLLHGGAADARMWSGDGLIEAPVIEVNQKSETLHAFAAPGSTQGKPFAVKAVLVQAPATASANNAGSKAAAQGIGAAQASSRDLQSAPASGKGHPAGSATLTRIYSRELRYRGGTGGKPGLAEFDGGVRLLQADEVITADSAHAVLQGSGNGSGPAQALGPLGSGGLQTLTADGHVRLVQGQQTATGSQLVYTAADRRAVLTGAAGAPPVLHDPAQGTITGTEVILTLGSPATAASGKGDNQVEVVGSAGAPVHTELDVPQRNSAGGAQGQSHPKRKARSTP